jgi:hypothetical protein
MTVLDIGCSIKKLALTASSIILGVGVMGVTPAQASLVFWDLDFFDESGEQVGDGEFSYNSDTTTFVQTSVLLPELFPIEGFEVQSALEVFSINVVGETFGLEDEPGFVTWWFDSDRNPGQQLVDPRRPVPSIRENSWFFPEGGSAFGGQWLFMDEMEEISNTLWVGDWNYIKFDSPTIPEPIFASGKWSAILRSRTVPEPTTTLGLLAFSALGAASTLKRKHQ